MRVIFYRIMLLNLLNLYSLIFALFSKIDGMGRELNGLQPSLCMNASTIPESALHMTEALALSCSEVSISCTSCNVPLTISTNTTTINLVNAIRSARTHESHMQAQVINALPTQLSPFTINSVENIRIKILPPHSSTEKEADIETTTENVIDLMRKQIEKLNQMFPSSSNETTSEVSESGEIFYDYTEMNTSNSSFEFQPNTVSEFTNGTVFSSTLGIDSTYSTVSTENTSSSNDYTSVSSTSDSDSTNSVTYTYTSPIFGFSSPNRSSVTTESTIISQNTRSMESPAPTLQYTTNSNLGSETETYTFTVDDLSISTRYPDDFTTELSTSSSIIYICPSITFNCTISCGGQNVTQVVVITDCTKVEKRCYVRQCKLSKLEGNLTFDYYYEDEHKRKMYNLTKDTKKKLLKLCWETMFGQELVKLTMMDLVSPKSVI